MLHVFRGRPSLIVIMVSVDVKQHWTCFKGSGVDGLFAYYGIRQKKLIHNLVFRLHGIQQFTRIHVNEQVQL